MTNSLCVVFKFKPSYKKGTLLKIPLIKIIKKKNLPGNNVDATWETSDWIDWKFKRVFISSISYSWAILTDDRECAKAIFL